MANSLGMENTHLPLEARTFMEIGMTLRPTIPGKYWQDIVAFLPKRQTFPVCSS